MIIKNDLPNRRMFPHTDEQYVMVSAGFATEEESRNDCLEDVQADAAILIRYERFIDYEIVSTEVGSALYVPVSQHAAAMTVFTCYEIGDDMTNWVPYISPREPS